MLNRVAERTTFPRHAALALLAVALAIAAPAARAVTIDLTPIPVPPGQPLVGAPVAENLPLLASVWNGVGESFKAPGTSVQAGFYLENNQLFNSLSNYSVTYSLYSGSGTSGSLLATNSVSVSLGALSSGLFTADFSSVPLTVGNSYTLLASLSSLPAQGSIAPVSVLFNSLTNGYADGRIWYTGGSSASGLNLISGQTDAALYVTTTSPVPLPASAWLLLSGLLGCVLLARRNRSRDVAVGFGG